MVSFNDKKSVKAWELLSFVPDYYREEYFEMEHDEMDEGLYSDFLEED